MEHNFAGDHISVGIQPSARDRVYTVEDFAEINCVAIEEHVYGDSRWLHLKLGNPSKENVIAAIRLLEQKCDIYNIYRAEPNFYWVLDATADAAPNDSYYTSGDQWAIDDLGLTLAWSSTTGSSTVTVGVIDTGIDASHPDLTNRVNRTLSKCFAGTGYSGCEDINGHGTHVAGIIGAQGNNSIGVVGTCWNVQLVSLRISVQNDSEGKAIIDTDATISAIEYATEQGIDVLNMSCGGFEYRAEMATAIADFPGVFVCSAGNTNTDLDDNIRYPGSYQHSNMIVVGASTSSNTKWYNSNHGSTIVDLFAPGAGIYSCIPGGGYSSGSGTSMATPYVAGVAALVLSVAPNTSPTNLKALIINNAVQHSGLSEYCKTGKLLNAYNVLDKIAHVHYYSDRYTSTGNS